MTDSYFLYLTGSNVYARRSTGPFWRPSVETLGQWQWDAADPASLRFEGLDAKKGRRAEVSVYAGAALCRLVSLAMPAGLQSDKERIAVTQARMRDQMGIDIAQWEFAVDSFSSSSTTIACAIRRNFLEQLRKLCTENHLRLASVKPHVAGVWNALQQTLAPSSPSLALISVEEDAFTTVVSRSGIWESAGTLLHNGEAGLVEREIRRIGFSFGAEMQENAYVGMPETLEISADIGADRLLRKSVYLKKELYADFRDRLFVSEQGAA